MTAVGDAPTLTGPLLIVGNPRSSLTRERAEVARRSGFDVHWYCPAEADYWRVSSRVEIAGTTTHHYPHPWIPKVSTLAETVHVARLLRTIRPRIVHVFMAYPRVYNSVLSRRHPLAVTVMGADILPDQELRGQWRRFWTRMLLDGADVITSKSEFMDDALRAIGDYSDKILRVTWGVDVDLFRPGLDVGPIRERQGIPADAMVFFSPRTCSSFYRQHVIIEGFARFLAQSSIPAVLLISRWSANSGYLAQLERSAEHAGIGSSVRFIDPIPRHELPLYLNLAAAMVSVPHSDGMPQTLYESMACGCFAILGDLPQYLELVDRDDDALLVPVDDADALASAFRWVADHRDHLEDAGRRARRKILRVADARRQEAAVHAMYRRLLGSDAGRGGSRC